MALVWNVFIYLHQYFLFLYQLLPPALMVMAILSMAVFPMMEDMKSAIAIHGGQFVMTIYWDASDATNRRCRVVGLSFFSIMVPLIFWRIFISALFLYF